MNRNRPTDRIENVRVSGPQSASHPPVPFDGTWTGCGPRLTGQGEGAGR